jgi:pimeloyl-ACP methyl ester carboxylesterase
MGERMKKDEKLPIVNDESPAEIQKKGTGGWRKWAAVAGILGGGGLAVHAILTRQEKKHLLPPGRMIGVNGHMMHICASGSGGPTVVLETGASGYFGAWEWVQEEVGKHTRVVSYDRAGLGFSEKASGKRDAASIARDLRALLEQSGEKPPYILVGHSYGGLLVMAFANLYPEQTGGLVLVDPSHPDQLTRSPELRKSMQNFRNFFHVASAASHFGVMRVTDLLSSMTEGLSGSERARARVFFVSGRHLKSSARELNAWNETAEQTRSVHFGNLPLLILSAPEPQVQWVRDFHKMHEEMSSLSTSATHRAVPGAEHLNIVTRRENALHVSRGILEVVDEARRRSDA